jgi:predicted ATP-binding protein involved in virulence
MHLAAVLQELSQGNSQIIVSTHSPLSVSGEGFEDVRMVRKDPVNKRSNIAHITYNHIAQAIASAAGKTDPQRYGRENPKVVKIDRYGILSLHLPKGGHMIACKIAKILRP